MMRVLAVIAAGGLLCACNAVSGVTTPHATLEKAETAAELAYQGAAPLLSPSQKIKAWNDLQAVRAAYDAGQDITALIATFQADLPTTKATQ